MQAVFGGQLIYGHLDYRIGQRPHWWCETEDNIIDPMYLCLKDELPCEHKIIQSYQIFNNEQNL